MTRPREPYRTIGGVVVTELNPGGRPEQGSWIPEQNRTNAIMAMDALGKRIAEDCRQRSSMITFDGAQGRYVATGGSREIDPEAVSVEVSDNREPVKRVPAFAIRLGVRR